MATESPTRPESEFGEVSRLKGVVFQYVSVVASWIGIVALGVLLVYVLYDAINLETASGTWYLLWAGAFLAPAVATTAYCYRNRTVGRVALRATAVVGGGVGAGFAVALFFLILDPPVWFAYVLTVLAPSGALAAVGYGVVGRGSGPARIALIPVTVYGWLLGAVATGGITGATAAYWGTEVLLPGVALGAFVYLGARAPSFGQVGAYAIGAVAGGLLVGYGLLGIDTIFGLGLPGETALYAAGVAAGLLGLAAYVVASDVDRRGAAGIVTPFLLAGAWVAGQRLADPVSEAAGPTVADLGATIGSIDPGTWTIYLLTVVAPAAVLAGLFARDLGAISEDGYSWLAWPVAVSVLALAGTAAVEVAGEQFGELWLFAVLNGDLWLIFLVTLVTPTAVYATAAVRTRDAGRAGLLAPVVFVGGIVLAIALENLLSVAGPESWVDWQFVTSLPSRFPAEAGLYAPILGSVFIISLVAGLSFPLGVGAAIYLEEYAPQTGWAGRLTRLIQVNISNLAGVPSVVYGLLGLGLFVNLVGLGFGTVLVASMTLSLLILPIVIISAQEAIRSVPEDLRQASYGMGATRWQTIRNVILPRAVPGILTGTILALGRAIGETAPLIMIGAPNSVFSAPAGPLSKSSAMPLQVFNWAFRPQAAFRHGVTAAGVVVLLVVLLAMNSIAILVRNKYQQSQ